MEKSQEQIRFENVYLDSMGGFWKHYAPQTAGNVIHWIHTYGNLSIAENIRLGDGKISFGGEPLLKYKYTEENPDIPYFYDLEQEKYDFIVKNQKIYLDGIKKFTTFVEETNKRYDDFRDFFNRPKAGNNN